MTIIADTGAIYACYDRSDQHHGAAKSFLGGVDERLWLPALVLAELDHLVLVRLGEKARAAVVADVLDTRRSSRWINGRHESRRCGGAVRRVCAGNH